MNGGGIRVGRIFGIPIVVDTSWLVIFFLIVFSFWVDLVNARALGLVAPIGDVAQWSVALLGAVLFFGSVLIHELSHSVVAVRRGTRVRRIRLFIFGGVSEIETEAANPQDEFAITIAGPASSVVLGGVFLGVAALVGDGTVFDRLSSGLGVLNLLLGGFNLLPGLPLDGGRVLRSIVWRTTGDYRRATQIAGNGGRIVAGLMIAVGVLSVFFRGTFRQVWWIVLGWFLFQAAGAALAQLTVKEGLSGVVAAQVMTRTPIAVDGDLTLQRVFDDHFMANNVSEFPVLQEGRVRGMISLEQLGDVPRNKWNEVRVSDAMQVLQPEDAVGAGTPAEEILTKLSGTGQRVVVVEDGRLVGVVTASDITRWIERQSSP
ncbi:MAG: site-2 protease family protein [Acidimicrobiia bacterium]|nr:site-2 protease family protein [Acidimicrobiia bacterium]MDH3396664.1 site-2 protease family protein [Acidimicrobiia bacterium]